MPLGPLILRNKDRRFLKTSQGILAIVFLGTTIILINGLQMLSLLIRPFSMLQFRRFNSFLAATWWGWCVSGVEFFHGTHLVVTGDDIPSQDNAIVIMNHQSMTDILVLLAFAKSKGRLGDLKWFVKDVLKYVPGVGWGMLFLDCLFIRRNWTEDKEYIHNIFDKFIRHSIPIWLISFVEGTRLRPSKLNRSQSYARDHGFVPLKHVLLPRTKGFVASARALRGHIQAIYDMTAGYVDGIPTLWQWICGDVTEVHLHIRRFEIQSLPQEEEELSRWLFKRFEEKDKLLEQHYQS